MRETPLVDGPGIPSGVAWRLEVADGRRELMGIAITQDHVVGLWLGRVSGAVPKAFASGDLGRRALVQALRLLY